MSIRELSLARPRELAVETTLLTKTLRLFAKIRNRTARGVHYS